MDKIQIDKLVDRFLCWPLPKSVCSDTCVSMSNYMFPRFGTSLLTADEARSMLEYLLKDHVCTNPRIGGYQPEPRLIGKILLPPKNP